MNIDPNLYHHPPPPNIPNFKDKSVAPPRKISVRKSRSVNATVIEALTKATSLATPDLQSKVHDEAFYVSVDGVLQTLHALLLGGCTRRDAVAALDCDESLGSTWFKFSAVSSDTAICSSPGPTGGFVTT
eukprot:CAMPEP_0197573128 /NCGR_PEP_ID=MMETSP1320-20131121/42809_1 /TAXON_ID=91990 /ORGANISM="Bolidomonas sp., Strain RCC2347" /LENGTH=129 /DNA_ID=CAMNT_0043135637 /DNA_START=685 /DNA_END=1070 /DNA_ORIENTATION=-